MPLISCDCKHLYEIFCFEEQGTKTFTVTSNQYIWALVIHESLQDDVFPKQGVTCIGTVGKVTLSHVADVIVFCGQCDGMDGMNSDLTKETCEPLSTWTCKGCRFTYPVTYGMVVLLKWTK